MSTSRIKLWPLTAIVILSALPMLAAQVPDAADYPNHLARHHIFASLGGGSVLDEYFTTNWRWVGNLGIDLPALILTPLIGVEAATRLISALIAPFMAVGIFMLSRAVHGKVTASAALALPFVFAQPFLFGFLNYCLSVALALIIAALWVSNDRFDWWRTSGFALAAVLVWTAHIMGWAILLILVAGVELAKLRNTKDVPLRALRTSPLLLPILPLLLWRSEGDHPLFWYSPDLAMSKVMNFVTVLKGLSMPLDLGMTALIGLLTLLAFTWAGKRKLVPSLAIAGTMLMVAALILPTTVLGSWGADLRLAPYAVMICIMAIGPAQDPRRERLLLYLGMSLFVLRACWTTAQWWRADHHFQERLAILDMVPKKSRLGFLSVGEQCGTDWTLTASKKLAAYAVVRRDAFTNTLFQIPGSDIMTIRRAGDRAWFDGSQDVAPLCPEGKADIETLRDRMERMKMADFDSIWIAGLLNTAIPYLKNYRVVYIYGSDVLLKRTQP